MSSLDLFQERFHCRSQSPGSASSFVSERLVNLLHLLRARRSVSVTVIAGSTPSSPINSEETFKVSPVRCDEPSVNVTAFVVPKVTTELPASPVKLQLDWTHLKELPLAYTNFGCPGRIDVILGVEITLNSIRHGRWIRPLGFPITIEINFSWVLGGCTSSRSSHHTTNTLVAISNSNQRPQHG